ncbi:MAG: DUF4886 domain-containing protein, partial [Erysipelotrichaceae bacterium]|nr:DUF4886 domain-containing protein [Erysipelotrichaceae bacterium]
MKLLMHKIYKWLLVLMLLIQSVPNYSSLHVHAEEEHDHEHEETQQVVEIDEKDYLDDGVFRLLLIGNSFSQDASNSGQTQLLDILKAMLPEGTKIEIGHYTSGGKTVAWYASRARNDEAFCSLSMITSDTGKWKGVLGKSTISTVLEYKDWDVVTIQPHGTETTKGAFDNSNTEEYHADLDMLDLSVSMPYMLDYIHEYAPQSDVYYYLSWATSGVAKYDTNGSVYNTMLDNVRKVQNYSGENKSISGVIPVGTAVQTARTSYLAYLQYNTDKGTSLAEDKNIGLTRDGWHVSYNIGRYIAALTFAETLIPESMRKDSYTLPSISDSQAIGKLPDEYTEIAQLCVNKAIESINYDADQQYAYTKLTEYQTDPVVTAAETVSKTEFVLNRIKAEEDLISALTDEIKDLVHDEIEINIELKNEFEPSADTFTAEVSLRFGYTTKTVEVSGTVKGELEGKKLSVLGASISTFAGTSNGDASKTTNSTIKNNAKYYPNTTIPEITLNDTWWMQVCEDLNLELLVNNSWSGSAILLERSGTVGAYVDRCVQLHDNTGDNAGEEPDIIIIQMGFNDFSYGKATLGDANINYEELITANGYGEPDTTMEATVIMLDKMTKRYPDAEIYMFSHFKRIGQSASDTALMEELNESVKTVCAKFGVIVVDLYTVLDSADLIGDGRLHPNRLGMDVMTEAFKASLVENTGYLVNTHKIDFELTEVASNYGGNKIVVHGDSFEVELTSLTGDPVKVTVMMGSEDITESVYKNGKLTISEVNDDVNITAKTVYVPQSYNWQLEDNQLICEENPLTMLAGTITDGQFSKVQYELTNSIVLKHNLPWIIEWKSTGSMKNEGTATGTRILTSTNVNAQYNARYLFKSSVNGLIAMGEKTTTGSHNYGLELADHDIDASLEHVYILQNRINDDGSNMIYLFVDGKEIGPMNNYYIGTADQGTTSDWLSGKDFIFPYMGTDTHGLTNCSIEYLQVWENGKPNVEMTLGDFKVAGVGTGALSASTVQLSQKSLVAVPYSGAELKLTVEDGYQINIYSGNNNNRINQSSGWLGTDGDNQSVYTYTLPSSSIYMRVSIRKSDGSTVTLDDVQKSGVKVHFQTSSNIVDDNKEVAELLKNADKTVLLHISDVHGDVVRAERAAQFAEYVGADALLVSGDLTAYEPDDWGSALLEGFNKYDVNV